MYVRTHYPIPFHATHIRSFPPYLPHPFLIYSHPNYSPPPALSPLPTRTHSRHILTPSSHNSRAHPHHTHPPTYVLTHITYTHVRTFPFLPQVSSVRFCFEFISRAGTVGRSRFLLPTAAGS